jgi:hypothetical protein
MMWKGFLAFLALSASLSSVFAEDPEAKLEGVHDLGTYERG